MRDDDDTLALMDRTLSDSGKYDRFPETRRRYRQDTPGSLKI
jgi:hypothetical protein